MEFSLCERFWFKFAKKLEKSYQSIMHVILIIIMIILIL